MRDMGWMEWQSGNVASGGRWSIHLCHCHSNQYLRYTISTVYSLSIVIRSVSFDDMPSRELSCPCPLSWFPYRLIILNWISTHPSHLHGTRITGRAGKEVYFVWSSLRFSVSPPWHRNHGQAHTGNGREAFKCIIILYEFVHIITISLSIHLCCVLWQMSCRSVMENQLLVATTTTAGDKCCQLRIVLLLSGCPCW